MLISILFFFFNDTATTEIYTLSLHDALPIYAALHALARVAGEHFHHLVRAQERGGLPPPHQRPGPLGDRKSTRLNSSHANISYAVFCLKKKKEKIHILPYPQTFVFHLIFATT